MLGSTTLSEKHKPLKEIWSINLHQEAPIWLTTVVVTDDGSVLTLCPKTRIWHSERSLVWTNSAESLGWWGVSLWRSHKYLAARAGQPHKDFRTTLRKHLERREIKQRFILAYRTWSATVTGMWAQIWAERTHSLQAAPRIAAWAGRVWTWRRCRTVLESRGQGHTVTSDSSKF